ncbi:Gfo/Idh/MocA family protein [Sabulicella glaciei]|uniref:Gfo/Idh/MocA family oxidoreductase n=1 Tax=Sabulicella glaciei TaxID=2984948 RepID=A0ABT3NUW3_9PROT|nr:Gfo/Idh/MocA family oxidoreductase [Roseococcus sp. MDT2-1-1]MCW8085942.1 Gfo/Idh/MocA family oxidoreductase [Roseococcus sp. MDT2-1-1]
MPQPMSSFSMPRRGLIRGTGAGLIAASGSAAAQQGDPAPVRAIGRPMPKLEREAPLSPEERVGFAVVGLGKFALNQILPSFAFCRQAKLVSLVSGDAAKAREVARQYGVPESGIHDYANYDRIADDPAIQVVYVILPNALHAEYTQRAFRAGKHVLCEKPMAVSSAEAREMIAAGRAAGRKLMVAYRAQYETFNRKAIEMIREGELGKLRLITSDHGRPAKPEEPADQWRLQRALAGGGSLFDVGIYAVNAMRYLSGEEPEEVMAMTQSDPDDPRFREVEDRTTWQFRMPSGLLCNGSTSYSYFETKRLSVLGTDAALRMDPATDYDLRRMWVSREGEREAELLLPMNNQFAAGLDHMAECVRENRDPRTPGEEGLRDMLAMEAIYEAARTGRTVRVGTP